MCITFATHTLPVLHKTRLPSQRSILPLTARRDSPTPHRHRSKRVRVPRKYTSKQSKWSWKGKTSGWGRIFGVEEGVIRVIEAFWSQSLRVSESSILARVTALGARVLRSMTDAIERTLYPDTEKELVVEYGITEPNPTDKTFIDPLSDWEVCDVTYYRDSHGRRVFLQFEGTTGVVMSTDFREGFDDLLGEEDKESEGENSSPNDTRPGDHHRFRTNQEGKGRMQKNGEASP